MQALPSVKKKYMEEVVPALTKQFSYSNVMQVPRLEKVVINVGVGEAVTDIKKLESAVEELCRISGQKPYVCRAKKSIASFKLREGMPIGCKVTLRSDRMYHFLERLMNIAIPRIRDFRGTSNKAFDGRGNYTLGIKEQLIFTEIDYDKVDSIRGLNVTIVTTAKTDEEARALLKELGMPFRK